MRNFTKIMDFEKGQIYKKCNGGVCLYYFKNGDKLGTGHNTIEELINGEQSSKINPKLNSKPISKRSRTTKKTSKKNRLD